MRKTKNGVVYTQKQEAALSLYTENFLYIAKFRYDSENFAIIAKFPAYSEISALFMVGYCSYCSIPFLLSLIIFILGLLKLIENYMKLMEINPTLL